MIVLWLLILRGISIELRGHINLQVWQSFFDWLFAFSSALLAVFYGAALANVIRGVPLGQDSYFFLPLWTNWRVGPSPGILDWYTVIGGVLALVALTVHGGLYLAVKTEGALHERARAAVKILWGPLFALTVVSLIATMKIRPHSLSNYNAHPVAYVIPVGVVLSLIGALWFSLKHEDRRGFGASAVYLSLMMAGAAVGQYPALLPSITDSALDLTVERSRAGTYALQVGSIWWTLGMLLAIGYFILVYRMFRVR
jgi:cytochrome d ubiquinol oxidase subunit II